MNTYKITEKQDVNSKREGYEVELKDIKAAKRHATDNQAFFGTVLVIEEAGEIVATKKGRGRWVA